jgi:peptidoglycan hydrolase-like protein with peptidoglycan-binding domain
MYKYNLGKGLLILSLLFFTILIPTNKSQAQTSNTSSFISFSHSINTQKDREDVQIILNKVLSPSPNLTIDGIWGNKTINAIKSFQHWRGITVDGKVGPTTRSHFERAEKGDTTTTCANGATNYPTCILPVTTCSNGATNYPTCTLPVTTCANGATNYPICTLPVTTCSGSTTISCTVSNGIGTKSRTCTNGAWVNSGTCTVSSCNTGFQIYNNACITTSDTTKPVITAFNIPTTSTSLTVPITSFTATDNVGVTGYLLTESSTIPPSSSFFSTVPANYIFTSSGTKYLYAWVRDAAGNISTPINRTVTITLPIVSCSGSTTTSCSITNGTGIQSRTCTNGDWVLSGSCTLSSCNSGYTQSGNTCVATITADTTRPVITGFSIPSTSSSLTVEIIDLSATDNVGVTHYYLSESSATPSATLSTWSIAPSPQTPYYTFSSTGTKTLYAWVKDAAGNISTPLSTTVTISTTTSCSGSTSTSCTIANGTGTQARTCTNGSWVNSGSCTLSSCNSGYTQSGNTCVVSSTQPIVTGTYYISPSGSDTASGTVSSPWKTLAHACSSVSASGSVIHVNSGTYNETSICYLAVGVSIEGEKNMSSIIYSSVKGNYWDSHTIQLASANEGTSGDQHISYLVLNGGTGINNEVATGAIIVSKRKNVEIHHNTIQYFFNDGIYFSGTGIRDGAPTAYATGNSFHDNTVLDSSTFSGIGTANGAGFGDIMIGGQQNIQIYNNNLTVSYRTNGINGYVIKYWDGGYNKGLKIFNNTMVRPPFSGMHYDFDFAIELWNSRGGVEIHDNRMYGSLDFGGQTTTDEGGYGYAAKVYNNVIGWDSMQSSEQLGIDVEGTHTGGLYIYNNNFKNLDFAIKGYQGFNPAGETVQDLYFTNNIVQGIREYAFYLFPIYVTSNTYSNINILNNDFYANGKGGKSAMVLGAGGNYANVRVRNNIVQGFGAEGPVCIASPSGHTLSSLSVENNLFYGNSYSSVYYYTTPSSQVVQNNLSSDPLFVNSSGGDFHLQSTSPAINKGINVGITSDYAGNAITGTPDIGAYESGL